ncbi:ABC transporter substrate-binding protein [Peptostreptococcus stomatis]|uniref:ABC transporter substrate-binding protein n=1 Tax=Peptostreptococcus stomatis TaxID=341694 RepID=UPI0026F03228|nr:PhnD/SsuA/transferrin family substrate-binding protein [Peptostreptococcus stomatis]
MKKKLAVFLAALLVATGLTACGQKEEVSSEPAVTAKVAALKGPTSMGMVKMMADQKDAKEKNYEFTIGSSPDEIAPKFLKGEFDIVALPSNLASILYNKSQGKVQVLAINTLGILYLMENGDTVKSVGDLKGRTIYSSGKGAVPEYAFNYILKANGLNPDTDLRIEYKSEHTEALAALLNDKSSLAVLPQPFATVASLKNKGLRPALDLTKEWDKASKNAKSTMITGVVVVNKDFAAKYPERIKKFMADYKASIDYTNTNVDDAAKLIEENNIVPAAVAKKAIPQCNITYIDGSDMKDKLSGYLQVLFEANPKSIGGKMPADDFYYVQKK